jgi:hypothetical protein
MLKRILANECKLVRSLCPQGLFVNVCGVCGVANAIVCSHPKEPSWRAHANVWLYLETVIRSKCC